MQGRTRRFDLNFHERAKINLNSQESTEEQRNTRSHFIDASYDNYKGAINLVLIRSKKENVAFSLVLLPTAKTVRHFVLTMNS